MKYLSTIATKIFIHQKFLIEHLSSIRVQISVLVLLGLVFPAQAQWLVAVGGNSSRNGNIGAVSAPVDNSWLWTSTTLPTQVATQAVISNEVVLVNASPIYPILLLALISPLSVGATVILAMGAGRRAAKGVATWLQLRKQKWPITPEDLAAFVPPQPAGARAVAPEAARAAQPSVVIPAAAPAAATGAQEAPAMLCPKCHRPLEGDESYVCCATATLQWRCDGCAKVSEGFAFPYGMCPACGGKLSVLDERRVEEAAALTAIRIAFEIELGGRAFYTPAAQESAEPALKDLFGRFAEMERKHMQTVTRRYHAQVPEPGDGFELERAAIYAGIPNHPDDRRTSAIMGERTTPTEFDFQAGRVLISCVNMDLGEAHEEVEITYTGEGVKIGFNARYILDFLSAVDSEVITLHLTDPLSPAVFRATGDDQYSCVIMPMRI